MPSPHPEDLAVLDRFAQIRQHVRGGVVAPNKPVTLLWALEQVARREDRLVPFAEAEPQLRERLDLWGTPGSAASYAFWRLQNDGIWEVASSSGDLPLRSGNKEPRITALRAHASGGFNAEVHARLSASPQLRRKAARLLERELERVYLRDAPPGEPKFRTRREQIRDAKFRRLVLATHGRRCAVCGFHFAPVLQAAHVQARSKGGPDTVDNGVPLCTFHHPLFDLGLFTWDEERRLVVSARWSDDMRGGMPSLHDYAGRRLSHPTSVARRVKDRYLDWHRRHVFAG